MGYPAGKLTRRITVLRVKSTATVLSSGQIDETDEENWEIAETRWANIVPRSSREFFRGQQVADDITHKITMRYDSKSSRYNAKNRITLGDRKFYLTGPGMNSDEQDVTLEFPATEIVL